MLDRIRPHRERAGAVRIDRRGGADPVLAHQRAEPREERRQLLGRRMRAREQRVLEHPPGRRVDRDRDALDRRGRRMRLEIEQRQRPQRPHVAHRRRQFEPPRMDLAALSGWSQPQPHVQHGDAAIAPFEARRQRLEQPCQDERQRLERLDRPLELERAPRSAPRAGPGRAAACPRRGRSPATPARPVRAARRARPPAAPTVPRASARPTVSTQRAQKPQNCLLDRLLCGLGGLCVHRFRDRRSARGDRSAAARALPPACRRRRP